MHIKKKKFLKIVVKKLKVQTTFKTINIYLKKFYIFLSYFKFYQIII